VSHSRVALLKSLTTPGVILLNDQTINEHTSHLYKSCPFHFRSHCHIRLLSPDMTDSVGVAIIQSRLDYANSLLYDTSEANVRKLQRLLTTLARSVVNYSAAASASGLLHKLHGLPTRYRLNFKIALLTVKILNPSCVFRVPAHRVRHLHIDRFAHKTNALSIKLEHPLSLEDAPSVQPHPGSGTSFLNQFTFSLLHLRTNATSIFQCFHCLFLIFMHNEKQDTFSSNISFVIINE
jgi:hypothetical protein